MTMDFFPADYRTGRSAFLNAAAENGLGVTSRMHPAAAGRDGGSLFLDTVEIGTRAAAKALLVISGTHGVEGYFGSAAATAFLHGRPDAPAGTKIVLLHALNPFGFSWDRRGDENNVDVNRNFVDHACPPANPAYEPLAGILVLRAPSPEGEAAGERALMAYAAAHGGEAAVQAALSRGQYRHPDGLFYGGGAPSWSQTMLFDVLAEELRGVESLVVLDLHTGLGAFGEGTILAEDAPEIPAFRRIRAVWPSVEPSGADAMRPFGQIGPALEARLPEVTFATLEIGTLAPLEILRALSRNDRLRAAFCPDSPLWRKKALAAAEGALAQAVAALG
jgi:hypothetical protein